MRAILEFLAIAAIAVAVVVVHFSLQTGIPVLDVLAQMASTIF